MLDNTFLNRVLHKSLWTAMLPLCLLWSLAGAFTASRLTNGAPRADATELPAQWQGRPLRPLALSAVEERFLQHFPGTLARMTNGQEVLVLRTVSQATRMLHPAVDCYQGLGYRIAAQQLERDADDALWRCFEALRGGERLRVCERIVDADGQGFTDTSAWYWSAALGRSHGPWQAVTVARAV